MRTDPFRPLALLPLLVLLAPAAPAQEEGAQGEVVTEVVTQEELETWTEEIRDDVAELRGKSFPRPVPVDVADAAKLREYMQTRLDKQTTPEEIEEQEVVAKLLGVLPAELDLLETTKALVESQVGGFYDPDTEGFYLMDTMGRGIARIILAHELTHALDDQLYDIDGTLEELGENADAQFAFHAVVEGSGTAVMNQWTMRHLAELRMEDLAAAGSMGMEELAEAPPFLWKPLLATYLKGAAFLNRTSSVLKAQMATPALEDFDTAFRSPPRSSEQVLHPEKYWDEAEADEPVAVRLGADALPEGWRVVLEDTFGEFGLGLVVEPLEDRGGIQGEMAVLAAKYTFPPSEGWGGDRYALLARAGARILVLETTWDTEGDAGEFHAVLDGFAAHLTESARATAAAKGVEGSGLAFGRRGRLGVWLWSWIGVPEEEARGVAGAVAVTTGEGE